MIQLVSVCYAVKPHHASIRIRLVCVEMECSSVGVRGRQVWRWTDRTTRPVTDVWTSCPAGLFICWL